MADAETTARTKKKADRTGFEPHIIGFLCNWCTYAGADLAGTSRISYPTNIKVVRVPCSGRVDAMYVINALKNGADGVLVSGCHPGDCHYNQGNYYARRRFMILREIFSTMGIDPERLQMSWCSAAEGAKWAQIVAQVTEKIRELGPFEGI